MRRLLALALALLLPAHGWAALGDIAVTDAAADDANPYTFTATCSGATLATDGLLVVLLATNNGGTAVNMTGCTADGSAMTEVRDDFKSGGHGTEIFYIKTPDSSVAISCTWTGSGGAGDFITAGSICVTGADQTTPIEADGTGTGTTDPSSALVTLTDGAIVVDVVAQDDDSAHTLGADQTQVFQTQQPVQYGSGYGSYESKATAGSVTMSWAGANAAWVQSTAAIKPSGGAPAATYPAAIINNPVRM